jgi:hypothetical protein
VSLLFDAPHGTVVLHGDAGDNTLRESLSPNGFLELTLDGQRHSSDPNSAFFDQALAGAGAGTLAGLGFDGGGGRDTLILGSQQLPGSFRVNAAGVTVVSEDVTAAGPVAITAQAVMVNGTLRGRQIDVTASLFVNTGQLQVSGKQLLVHADKVLNAGGLTADGGGSVRVEFTDSYIDTSAAVTSASGGAVSPGGSVTIDGGSTGRLYSSGSFRATGSVGGNVDLFGRVVVLGGATVDTSGEARGGSVRVGGDFQGKNTAVANAQAVTVTGATTLRADALGQGNGGRVIAWAERQNTFAGSASARGGVGEAGGLIEVSARGRLNYSGSADAGALHGTAGTLLLDPKNLVISAAPAGVLPQFDLIDPHPTAGGGFGFLVTVLSNGNVVVTNPNDDFGGTNAGAVYLFDGLTGALISSLVGSAANDQVGTDGTYLLSNGNYLVRSTLWNGNRGAMTWGSATAGVSGAVSEANSLVGSSPDDQIGSDFDILRNGNYVVLSPFWNSNRGAVTLGDGTTGVRGVVSEANSFVGSNPGDGVSGVALLSNGNYVVATPHWNANRGAVTWLSATDGVRGVVSEANSLVGTDPGDQVGSSVTPLSNGNYVVGSPNWNGSRGALTCGNGTTGVRGIVSQANSLVGSDPGDLVGSSGFNRFIILSNGNYVLATPNWNGNRGAVTWGDGTSGVHGAVSEANSLVGSDPNDQVGSNVRPLRSGNFVVFIPSWNGNRGAVTWGSGTAGVRGIVSEANSLVGSDPGDLVGSRSTISMSSGSYLVGSPNWSGNRGAVTWGDGTAGISGVVSEANSLVGSSPGDMVGTGSFASILNSGNYLVFTPNWNGNRGAVTWGDGTTGSHGVVSEANSLVGSDPGDLVGSNVSFLSNGNYVALSRNWNGNRGAATWGSGTGGVRGVVSAANSLVGSDPGDLVGFSVTGLSNDNYVVRSPNWNGNRGAATWGSGTAGVDGVVSAANSLVGSNADDRVGTSGIPLQNGNYVVGSPNWNGNRGALTWGDGTVGGSGTVSEINSLVGSSPGDMVGASSNLAVLSSGNYVILIPNWNSNRGAATWGDGSTGARGVVSEANSLVGSNPGDQVGYRGTLLSNGNYVIRSPRWNGNRGAVTWGDGHTGVRGVVSATNSLVGSGSGYQVGGVGVIALRDGNYVVGSLGSSNRGAITWVDGTTGQTLDGGSGITAQNSLIGMVDVDAEGLPPVVENSVTHTFIATFPDEGTGRVTAGLVDPNLLTYALAQDQTVTVTPDFLTRTLNTGTAVVLQASNDITVNDPIIVSAGGHGGALTLQAGRSIVVNASITTDNGALTLIANDTLANGVVDAERDPGPAVITMADGADLDTGTGALTIELRDGAGLTNSDSGAVTLQTVAAGSVSVTNRGPSAGSDIVLGPVTTAGAQSYSNPSGTTRVTGNLAATDSPVTFADAVLLNAGLTLSAGSSLVSFAGGVVVSPGALTVAGGVVLSASSTFNVTLNGTDPDSYSHVTASGPVDLGGSTLSLTLGFTPDVGEAFTLLSSDAGPITGTFAGLDEGAVFGHGGILFQITYQGGRDGNSVVLTRVA